MKITPERGKVYLVKHTSGRVLARFIDTRVMCGNKSISGFYHSNTRTHYIFQNLRTGRDIELKSRVKIICELPKDEIQ